MIMLSSALDTDIICQSQNPDKPSIFFPITEGKDHVSCQKRN